MNRIQFLTEKASLSFAALFFSLSVAVAQPNTERDPKIGGVIETWYSNDESTPSTSQLGNTFAIRRARLIVSGSISDSLSYRVQSAFEGPGAKLFDAFIEYRWAAWLQIKAGQFKYPFTLEGVEGVLEMPMILRAESINFFAGRLGSEGSSFRDIGIECNGMIPQFLGFQYRIAVINGNGINQLDNNRVKDIVGRFNFSPVTGLLVGVSAFLGQSGHGDANGRKESGFVLSSEYAPENSQRLRLRAEFLAARRSDEDSVQLLLEPQAYYVLVSYRLMQNPGALELGLRWEEFTFDKQAVGSKARLVSLGVSYYFSNFNRIRLNYVIRTAEGNVRGTRHLQETVADGRDIRNVLLAQVIIGF